MSNCEYTYKGKKYSTDRIYRVLVNELPSRSQQESVDFLKNVLGMEESEIQIVKGLIDNRSLGRFKADGTILLSDLADLDVAYHEAFHRIWRMYLSSEERVTAIREMKLRKNFQDLVKGYKETYPNLSENELIEEMLADEFYDYKLNSDFKTTLPLKSLFSRLVNFLKKLIGLKPSDIQTIYNKILASKYKTKSAQQYLKDADKILIGGYEFSVEEKNEIIQVLTQRFVKGMLQINGDVDAFVKGGSTKIRQFLDQIVIPSIGNDLLDLNDDNGDLVNAIYEDVEPILQNNTTKLTDSILIEGLVRNLKLIGLNIKDDFKEDETEGALDDDTKAPREFTPSIEIDPKSRMGTKIKLLLSSLVDSSETTSRFGLAKPVSWTKAFVQIGTRMMGIPVSAFREEFKLLNLSYVPDLVKILEKDRVFEDEFISTLAMTENKFLIQQYKDGEIYFYDANSGTRRDKVLNEWRNNLLKQMEDWDAWILETKNLNNKRADNEDILEHFGFTLNEDVVEARSALLDILDKVSEVKEKPESNSLFKDLNIDGLTKYLADQQAKFEDSIDTMVSIGSNKLYIMGLNTQQTRVIDGIKYAQTKFVPKPTDLELEGLSSDEIFKIRKQVEAQNIDIIRQYAPMQVSEFNVTKQKDGTYVVHNKWLEKILNGERLNLTIPYIIQTQSGEELEISKLNEPDLFSMHLNGALQGMNMSMKHSDRGTFFAYNFGNNKPLYSKESNTIEALTVLEKNIIEQLNLERKFALAMKRRNLPIQHIGKDQEGAFFKDILASDLDAKQTRALWNKFLEDGEFDSKKIKSFVLTEFNNYKADVKKFGLLDTYNAGVYSEDKKEKTVSKLKGINQKLRVEYGDTELLLASAFVNEVSSHIFEIRFFSGDVRSFKNGTDLFKRLSPQSSNGKVSVVDTVSNLEVKKRLNQEFEILNPVTGKVEKVNPALKIGEGKEGYFRAVTGAERENYQSHLLDLASTPTGNPVISKLTGKQESKLFMLFEFGFINDFPDQTIEELQKTYEPKLRLYEKKYKEANENDGLSYMTLPAFKNFMIRQGQWTDGMELVYQTEMKIANMTSMDQVAELEIEIDGVSFKPFEIKAQQIKNDKGEVTKSVDGWSKRVINGKIVSLDSVHTLKTQFGGYSSPEEYFDESKGKMEYLFNTVLKTSQHGLIPSAILGTNLQLMNFSMLTNGIDIYHMGSANKVGGVDPKLAAKNVINTRDTENVDIRSSNRFIDDIAERGLDFYSKDGYFNHEALTENLDILSYLSNWEDLKDQVKIGNKVKSEIKGSTQSLKIMLSNLIVNKQERFIGAQDIVNKYKEVVETMVQDNHGNLLKKIGFNIDSNEFDSLDKLKETILSSSQMESAPDNIRNAVENFFNSPEVGLEVTPMKNKIENVLYSLITSGIISFDRPGSSYPQAAVTGYEKLGSRTFNEDGTQRSNQDTLKFYNPIFDEKGYIVKVEPAEIIIPLPDKWIKPLLKWAGTNNLVKAIQKLNLDIEQNPEKYQVKGLRIPNQQLSSNDFFQIKKFHLPTMQNYVLVPTETVVKVGSDFDIDKLNIYWGDIKQNIFGKSQDELEDSEENVSNSSLDQTLLNYEREILLHPRNIHHLLMPLTDEIFVKDIYDFLVEEGLIETPTKSSVGSILPSTNVRNTVIFVKGKDGVGPVALGITNSATNQADTLDISQFYVNQDQKVRPTRLLFEGMGGTYALDNYTDNRGTVISEILSQLLTTQVDNVKNPTAVLMNINMQTLGVVLYLIRRKINPKSIVLFLQQPIIAKYLEYQRQNESLLNKQVTMFDKQNGEVGKSKLIKKLLADLGYRKNLPEDIFTTDFTISNNQMLDSAKAKKFDDNQLNYLAYFQDLVEQSRTFSDFQQTQNSDTKGLKDKQGLDEAEQIRGRVYLSGIISELDVARLNNSGVISPFYQFGRRSYGIYDRFYKLAQTKFGGLLKDFKNAAADNSKGAEKDRVRQTIENDFILFLVHNYVTSKQEFNQLLKGDSVAKRIRAAKEKLPSNLVLKSFLPIVSNSTDLTDGSKIDNLRLFEKELNSLDSNDLRLSMEEIYEADQDLYNDLVKLLMFQSGLNISPFNYRNVIPVGLDKSRNEFNEYQYLYADILKQAFTEMSKQITTTRQAEATFEQFMTLFAANNPQFLNKNSEYLWKGKYPYKLAKIWDRKSKSFKLVSKTNQDQPQLGNAYQKQYFVEQIDSNLFKTQSEKAEEDFFNNIGQDDPIKFDVVAKPLGQYELFPGVFANDGQKEALDKLNKFLNSSEQEFTLIGRGGTGKTTIIKKILQSVEDQGKVVLGITVAHKAKKVLGRSIGKNKVKTVASALAIKLDESTGKFTPDIFARANDRVPIKFADIIIVDEASMISPSIYDEIMSLKERGAKVIFMGDNAQLPPVGEQVDSPVFGIKNQYTLLEKMRQAKTSPIINVGTMVADNIESKSPKLVAITNRANSVDPVSKSQTVFISDESVAIDNIVKDIEKANKNPDFVKAVTFNNEKHNSPQSVKNLNDKIRLKLFKEKSKNQFNVGEMVTAYDSYSKDPGAEEIHNSDDFVVKSISSDKATGLVKVFSRAKGERTFRLNYETLILELMDSEGEIYFAPVIADASKQQFEKDLQELWKTDTQLGFAVKGSFANIQYGYAITSHKAQGSTYTNTYVFEDNILGPSNAGDTITKNKSLYVAVSRPTTKLVMISEKNEDVANVKPLTLPVGEKNVKLKIISGGQFGGDLGGLLAAKELGLETGGTAPKGFKVDEKDKRSFNNSNPDLVNFGLVEDDSSDYPSRTMKNVDNSDGTIAFMWGSSVGTSKTIGYTQTGVWQHMNTNFRKNPIKPYLIITTKDEFEASVQIKNFVQKYNINTLNIAGHRETSQPGIELFVKNSLVQGLKDISVGENIKPTQGLLFELDQSTSQYSPSIKMYEGFIKLNHLYQGDEILPFIGESEYYRYLVPMLLNMNPDVKTEFTSDMGKTLRSYLSQDEYDFYGERWKDWPAGMSTRTTNTNLINTDSRVKLTTIVHELTHRTLQKEYEKNGEFKTKIDELYSSTSDFDGVDAYGFTNPREFLAEAMSNPDFMAVLNNIPYKGQTVWTYLMTLVSDFINNLLNIELNQDSVLAEVIRVSERVLQNNITEVGKNKRVSLSELGNEIIDNWNDYFPQYSWMNDAQKQMTAKLVEEGKITLNCSF